MNMKNWQKVGSFGVDAGICWIGDPCYVLHKEKLPDELGKDWGEFCDKLGEEYPTKKVFYHGICLSTGYGDGEYDVEAIIENSRIKEFRVKFF